MKKSSSKKNKTSNTSKKAITADDVILDLDLIKGSISAQETLQTFANTVITLNTLPNIIADTILPIQNVFEQINKNIYQAMNPIIAFSEAMEKQQETIKNMLNSLTVFPFENLSEMIDESTRISFDLSNVQEYRKGETEYLDIEALSSHSIDLPLFHYKSTQRIEMRLSVMDDKLDYIIDDNRIKDKKISALLDLIENKNQKLYEIEAITYDEPASILMIDKIEISIKGSYQPDLCKILFANKENLNKRWQFDEIAELWNEDLDNINQLNKIIYQVCRRIDDKVAQIAHINDFLIYDTHSVLVNPKYIPSIK